MARASLPSKPRTVALLPKRSPSAALGLVLVLLFFCLLGLPSGARAQPPADRTARIDPLCATDAAKYDASISQCVPPLCSTFLSFDNEPAGRRITMNL